jgi:hypothetical protein
MLSVKVDGLEVVVHQKCLGVHGKYSLLGCLVNAAGLSDRLDNGPDGGLGGVGGGVLEFMKVLLGVKEHLSIDRCALDPAP